MAKMARNLNPKAWRSKWMIAPFRMTRYWILPGSFLLARLKNIARNTLISREAQRSRMFLQKHS
ncbi:hypothetical protein GLE_4019 [Lysobacter enzymogenes]|uniref:Uncharacterized protein n=1 Tax=Lysobacter enzymogenes TaxID=69 RepID=A0A0S2DLU3_LYSEN|nr:hypothetical protein GLE_4019 [Lysobacter enzymogenes]